ncbi:hypothetical protein VPNG_02054 [Cytospora leucostoma]|uniref:Uncharacterized protein n=1 Tax=Cytospora leucostoma TaxID=1230097 RepID=A0A423XHJ7_9PEZI|nr:hypothetical protein VPNG_02054 [Cytospora leucostoma]
MGFGLVAGLASAGLASLAMAQDILFHSSMTDTQEYSQATDVLGYTVHVATPEEWNSYTTADFMRYNAIIIPDPTCGTVSEIDFFDATKAAWGPAIMGNIILIGTDPSFHASSRPGALTLIDDGVEFAAAGNGTGLYFALSCYYDAVASSTVDALSYFGTITVRGQLACYNDAHLVANSSALGRLDDAALSDWSCSVHEVFTGYPTTGLFGFEPLAIAEGATGDGQRDFADGSNGIPYIIVKGATPAGCGDGIYDPSVEEECDDGPLNGTPESSCSSSCKCLNGSIAPGFLGLNGADELCAWPDQLEHRVLVTYFPEYRQRYIDAILALEHGIFHGHPRKPLRVKWICPYGARNIILFRHIKQCRVKCHSIFTCVVVSGEFQPHPPSLDGLIDSFSTNSPCYLLYGGRKQQFRSNRYFVGRNFGVIVRVVHKLKRHYHHIGHIARFPYCLHPDKLRILRTEFVRVYGGHDCDLKHCSDRCPVFFAGCDSFGFLQFELFQGCLYLRIFHNSRDPKLRDWVIIISCVVFSGPTRVSDVPVSSTAESSSASSTTAGYLGSSKSEESSIISTTKTSTFVTTIATNISTSQVTDMTTTKDLPAADNFTVSVRSELELKWCAFFWGTILWGIFVRGTAFRDTFHGSIILGVIVRRVLIPNDRVFDQYTPISAVVIRTKLCALCRKLAHHQNCEPELANNDHHKSHRYHCHKPFYNADYGCYNDFRSDLDH